MELKGTVKQILEEQSGTSSRGPWRKQDFILETEGDYPKTVCITMWGDSIDQFSLQPEEKVTAHIDIQSREYNGRWYTDVKAWKLEKGGGAPASPTPPSGAGRKDDQPPVDDYDDLPF